MIKKREILSKSKEGKTRRNNQNRLGRTSSSKNTKRILFISSRDSDEGDRSRKQCIIEVCC